MLCHIPIGYAPFSRDTQYLPTKFWFSLLNVYHICRLSVLFVNLIFPESIGFQIDEILRWTGITDAYYSENVYWLKARIKIRQNSDTYQ